LGRFSARGVQTTTEPPQKYSYKKSMSKTKKIDKVSMSKFSRSLLLYRVFGCFSAIGVQKHNKKVLQKNKKNRVEKFAQKNHFFFLDLVLSRFGAFLGEGSSKTPQKISIK
jgi:hypothetical protein